MKPNEQALLDAVGQRIEEMRQELLSLDRAGALAATVERLRVDESLKALRDFVRSTALDFVRVTETSFGDYDQTAWFSAEEVAKLPLVEGDLAIRGVRVDKASPDDFSIARSIAHERHLAANWLCEGPEKYSATDVST